VTRKEHAFAVYWREVSPHIAMLVLVVGGFLYGLLIRHHPYAFSPATIYWVVVFTLLVGRFVTKSWFGVSFNWSSALGAVAGTGRRRSERRG
jgi:hypothetical protein